MVWPEDVPACQLGCDTLTNWHEPTGRAMRSIRMLRSSLIVGAVVFAFAARPAVANHSRAGRPALDVSGTYDSNWGAVHLVQTGQRVTGDYVWSNGHLDGVLDGNMLRYHWTESDGSGQGVWVVASNGQLIGTWGTGQDDLGGGGWRLTPKAAIAAP